MHFSGAEAEHMPTRVPTPPTPACLPACLPVSPLGCWLAGWLVGWSLQGEFNEPVKADDCMWNMVDSTVELTLTKVDGMHWCSGGGNQNLGACLHAPRLAWAVVLVR